MTCQRRFGQVSSSLLRSRASGIIGGIEAPKECKKENRGERWEARQRDTAVVVKNTAFTPFKRNFLAILSGIPLKMPAQNGRKGGGEEATIPTRVAK